MGLPTDGLFGEVEEKSFDLLPNGTYLAVVYAGEIKESGENAKHPGVEYINWELAIQDEAYENRRVWHITSLYGMEEEHREEDPEGVKTTLGMLKSFLLAVGYTEEELADKDFEIDIDEITGRYVKIEVGTKKATDDWPAKNTIRRLMPVDGEDADELP